MPTASRVGSSTRPTTAPWGWPSSTRRLTPATGGSSPTCSTRATSRGRCAQLLIVGDPEPTHFVDVSDHFDAAVASLSAHAAYLEALGADYPKPADLLEMILGGPAEVTGARYAVAGRLVG